MNINQEYADFLSRYKLEELLSMRCDDIVRRLRPPIAVPDVVDRYLHLWFIQLYCHELQNGQTILVQSSMEPIDWTRVDAVAAYIKEMYEPKGEVVDPNLDPKGMKPREPAGKHGGYYVDEDVFKIIGDTEEEATRDLDHYFLMDPVAWGPRCLYEYDPKWACVKCRICGTASISTRHPDDYFFYHKQILLEYKDKYQSVIFMRKIIEDVEEISDANMTIRNVLAFRDAIFAFDRLMGTDLKFDDRVTSVYRDVLPSVSPMPTKPVEELMLYHRLTREQRFGTLSSRTFR
jgi:hypothetical protein